MTRQRDSATDTLSGVRFAGQLPPMSRAWLWLQLLAGWLPLGVLFALLVLTAHADSTPHGAIIVGLRGMIAAAALGFAVRRFTNRRPWPDAVTARFVGWHVVAATVYSVAWLVLNSAIESIIRWQLVVVLGPGLSPYLVLGIWLYVMTAGIAYAVQTAQRATRAEAEAARAQLAALRAQLNPHFLFNALHTVVQLIPLEPARASKAAEQMAGLLRTTLEEERELVSLREEWAFVQRYLDVEQLRFGDRLIVRSKLRVDASDVLIPAFAVQTLVENAVRHGASPRIEPTTITMTGRRDAESVVITVKDDGQGASSVRAANGGTGLRRLRERLDVLYRHSAHLDVVSAAGQGFTATLRIPASFAGD